jgi:hypothetical protein
MALLSAAGPNIGKFVLLRIGSRCPRDPFKGTRNSSLRMISFFKRGSKEGPATRGLPVLPILVCVIFLPTGPSTRANVNDFVAYWAASRQVLHGNDPYAAGAVLEWEREIGFAQPIPLIMRNPPWTVPVIILFGLLPFAMAQQLWLACGLIAIVVSARWLWELYLRKSRPPWMAGLVAAVFLPVVVTLAIGQISPLVLLGIAGFLHFEGQGKPGWAGTFLFLAALKPHLAFLFWFAFLLWSIRTAKYRTLISFTAAVVAASLVAIAFDNSIFKQYFSLLTRGGVLAELTPTVSGGLRLWLGRYAPIQGLPALLACLWFIAYWRKFRDRWRWREMTPMLVLISLLTTSYSYFFDQVILLPCVFQAAAWLATRQRVVSVTVALLYLAVNVAVLALILEHRTIFWYVWTVPAWFGLYWISRAGVEEPARPGG